MPNAIKVNKGGMVVIPVELRRELGWKIGDTICFDGDGDKIIAKSRDQDPTSLTANQQHRKA